MPESGTREKKKGLSRYAKGLLVLFLACCLLIAGALVWLYKALQTYEATTPNAALATYFKRLAAGELETIHAESGFTPTRWNTWAHYDAFITQLFENPSNGYTWRATAGQTEDGGKLWQVYAGAEPLGKVALYEGAGQNGGWRVSVPMSYCKSRTVSAPGHVTVYVNGEALLPQDASETRPLAEFDGLEEPALMPKTLDYVLEPMLFEPDIKAMAPNGSPCLMLRGETDTDLVAKVVLPPEDEAAMAARLEAAARLHALYITGDAAFDEVQGCLYPGTDFYHRLRTFDSQWYVDHDSASFREVEVTNIESHAEDSFTGNIHFVYQIHRGTHLHEFPSAYRMSFTLRDGTWQLVQLQVL